VLPMIAAAGIPRARMRTYFIAAAKTAGLIESFPMIARNRGRANAKRKAPSPAPPPRRRREEAPS